MIKKITVTNYVGETLEMDLFHPEDSGFIIREIQGLGPVKSNINTSESATMDGTRYNSAISESRNIVLSLTFLWNPTIEDMRLKSYRYFPNKKPLTFKVETDRRTAAITGYVESNEPDIFSEQEGCEISIICPDPYFYSTEIQETEFFEKVPLFEFPFSNESLTEPLLVLGEHINNTIKTITYLGDAEVGVDISIHALGPFGDLTIRNTKNNKSMSIDMSRIASVVGSDLRAEDDIFISTTRGKKSVTLTRDAVEYNILPALGRNVDWLDLEIGDNTIYYTTSFEEQNVQMTIENKVIYTGV